MRILLASLSLIFVISTTNYLCAEVSDEELGQFIEEQRTKGLSDKEFGIAVEAKIKGEKPNGNSGHGNGRDKPDVGDNERGRGNGRGKPNDKGNGNGPNGNGKPSGGPGGNKSDKDKNKGKGHGDDDGSTQGGDDEHGKGKGHGHEKGGGNKGLGQFVRQLVASGVRGEALAAAIRAELDRRHGPQGK